MAGETIITLVGNLPADPDMRYTPNGAAVANFTVASTPRTFDRQTNDFKDGDPMFIRCNAWRDMAEHVTESLHKGMRVIVQGRLKQVQWEKDGVKRSSFELDVDEVGPSLRWAIAQVSRASSNSGGGQVQRTPPAQQAQQQDPWGASAGTGAYPAPEEPPF